LTWHLFDYYLDTGAGYFAVKKGLRAAAYSVLLRRSLHRGGQQQLCVRCKTPCRRSRLQPEGKEIYSAEAVVDAAADSAQRIFSIPEKLYQGSDRILSST